MGVSGRGRGNQESVPSNEAADQQHDAHAQIESVYISAYYQHPSGEETQRKMTCKSLESAREFIDELEITAPDVDVPSDDPLGGGQK